MNVLYSWLHNSLFFWLASDSFSKVWLSFFSSSFSCFKNSIVSFKDFVSFKYKLSILSFDSNNLSICDLWLEIWSFNLFKTSVLTSSCVFTFSITLSNIFSYLEILSSFALLSSSKVFNLFFNSLICSSSTIFILFNLLSISSFFALLYFIFCCKESIRLLFLLE